jgi:hypothetical protein
MKAAGQLRLLAHRDQFLIGTGRQLSGRSGSGRAAEFAASVDKDPSRTSAGGPPTRVIGHVRSHSEGYFRYNMVYSEVGERA